MKYEMEYACGHTTTVDCTMDDRDHMRDLIGRTFCPDCWGRMCAEVRAIRKVWGDYSAAFNHWREEGCEGNPPAAPAVAITDIAAKYPRAAAFVEAEDFSQGADDAVCAMCRKAMEKILRGEDYTKAIEKMHQEWNNWNPLEEARKWILAEGQKKSAGGTE